MKVFPVLLLFSSLCVAGTVERRPNILLLMAEDMNQHVHALGDPVAVTPNLDRLATEGVSYPHTFATAGVCAPSRAAIIMGAMQTAFGGQHMRTSSRPAGAYLTVPPADMKAFPELLRSAGYYTFTNNKLDYQFSGTMTGSGPFTIWDDEGHNIDWSGRPKDRPFFGYMNFLVTHETGVFTPLGYWPHSLLHFAVQVWRAWEFGIPPVNVPVKAEDLQLPPYYPDISSVRADVARHYNNISLMDSQIGELVAKLESDGLLENTIVIWTADNGDALPRAKRDMFDSGIKEPLIIRWPEKYRPAGVEPGEIDQRLLSFVDLAPTILSLAGVEVPNYMEGGNIADSAFPGHDYIYAARDRIDEVYDRQRLVRDLRFEYIYSYYPQQESGHYLHFRDNVEMVREMFALHDSQQLDNAQDQWFKPPGSERLFDLQADPYQVGDVSDDPAYREVLLRMRAEYTRWHQTVPDWSDEHEDSMVARFEPNGRRPTTAKPDIAIAGDRVTITSTSEGASIGYRVDGGRWMLYSGPVTITPGHRIESKAIRYGWEESEVASYTASAAAGEAAANEAPVYRIGELRQQGRAPVAGRPAARRHRHTLEPGQHRADAYDSLSALDGTR